MCKKKCKCLKYKFSKGTYPKKYKVIIYRGDKKIKTTQFGDQRYGQYQTAKLALSNESKTRRMQESCSRLTDGE